MAMSLVSAITVPSGGASSLEFTNIPQTGKDLLVVISARLTAATVASDLYFYINNSNVGSTRFLRGTGSGTNQGGYSNSFTIFSGTNGANSTTNAFSNVAYYFSNYSSSLDKSFVIDAVAENAATEGYTVIAAGAFSTSSPITSLRFEDGTYVQNTIASLYIIS